MRKVELLPTRDCEAGYGPAWNELNIQINEMQGLIFVKYAILLWLPDSVSVDIILIRFEIAIQIPLDNNSP